MLPTNNSTFPPYLPPLPLPPLPAAATPANTNKRKIDESSVATITTSITITTTITVEPKKPAKRTKPHAASTPSRSRTKPNSVSTTVASQQLSTPLPLPDNTFFSQSSSSSSSSSIFQLPHAELHNGMLPLPPISNATEGTLTPSFFASMLPPIPETSSVASFPSPFSFPPLPPIPEPVTSAAVTFSMPPLPPIPEPLTNNAGSSAASSSSSPAASAASSSASKLSGYEAWLQSDEKTRAALCLENIEELRKCLEPIAKLTTFELRMKAFKMLCTRESQYADIFWVILKPDANKSNEVYGKVKFYTGPYKSDAIAASNLEPYPEHHYIEVEEAFGEARKTKPRDPILLIRGCPLHKEMIKFNSGEAVPGKIAGQLDRIFGKVLGGQIRTYDDAHKVLSDGRKIALRYSAIGDPDNQTMYTRLGYTKVETCINWKMTPQFPDPTKVSKLELESAEKEEDRIIEQTEYRRTQALNHIKTMKLRDLYENFFGSYKPPKYRTNDAQELAEIVNFVFNPYNLTFNKSQKMKFLENCTETIGTLKARIDAAAMNTALSSQEKEKALDRQFQLQKLLFTPFEVSPRAKPEEQRYWAAVRTISNTRVFVKEG